MKALVIGAGKTPSLLERLARKIEPTDAQLAEANKLPAYSREAKRLKPAAEVIKNFVKPGAPEVAKSTGVSLVMHDQEPMVYCTDGSLRHAGGRVKGKALRKAIKRARRR